ncbi:hypothetical protein [Limnobacter sp.]|uniref:hypothetical protein n=1 Tax=Limnobacter sp. TaxID=2003368 RepID=UPI0035138119
MGAPQAYSRHADNAAQEAMLLQATAEREAAINRFREGITQAGVTPEQIVLLATDLKEVLGSVSAVIDVAKTISDEAKRIIERAMQ